MKIAVCLSGQPRSIEYATESILNYFNSEDYEVDYFCHSWDYNTWKCKNGGQIERSDYESVDISWLETQLHRFNPRTYKIDSGNKIHPYYNNTPWASLFYSIINANMFKMVYEVKNDFIYDYVVKSRYDVIFPPDRKFIPATTFGERHLYFNHCNRMVYHANMINASDPVFYGDSWGMDIIADSLLELKRTYENPYLNRLDQPHNAPDPGIIISARASKYNIIIEHDLINPHDTIYRKEMLGTHSLKDFDKIQSNHRSYYSIV